jgi:acetyl/propionyl-CoA carboxylase alpha subunit
MDALAEALRTIEVWPVTTNAALLANLLDHPDARDGVSTTSLVEDDLEDLTAIDDAELADALVLGAAGIQALAAKDGTDPWSVADGFRINGAARATFVFEIGSEIRTVRLETNADGSRHAHIGGETFDIDIEATVVPGGVLIAAVIADMEAVGVVRDLPGGPVLFTRGRALALRPPELGLALEGLEAGDDIRAPMPGKVLDVKAVVGAEVKKGAALVVMEAMKMEHTLIAPRDGVIAMVSVTVGAQTTEGVVLVRMEPKPE